MGIWGAGIFSDDTACDVRTAYRDDLADGLDGVAVTNKLIESFGAGVDDPDDGPSFWLGLAATQCRYGRLEERVRDRALSIISDGSDLRRFSENAKAMKARAAALEKLRLQLSAPPREPVKIRDVVLHPSQHGLQSRTDRFGRAFISLK